MTETVYHTRAIGATGADESAHPPRYRYVVVPPIERLLIAIGDHCGVGGTIRPRNRQLADWANYASAGHISPLLDQLACDGWILYDRATGLITLLFDPAIGSVDPASDQVIPAGIDSEDDADSALIPTRDRLSRQQDAEYESIPTRDQNTQRMEDSCLAAALDSESAAARYKLPCGDESIPTRDQTAAALVMAELGTNAKLRAQALAARPDLTPQQVRDTWAHFEPRIAAKRCTVGAFHAALANGEIHPAPPDPDRPIDPAAYADKPGYALGSDLAPPGDAATIRDHASRLLPPPTARTIREHTRDWIFLQGRLAQGDSDEAALQALEARRSAVRR